MDESVVAMWLVRAFDGVVNITKKLIGQGLPIGDGAIQHVEMIHTELGKLLDEMKSARK